MQLDPNQIRLDGGTQPRAKLLLEVIEDYAEQMRQGDSFPPVTVFFDGKEYWLADGFHRVMAARQARPGQPIEVDVQQGTQSQAQWFSYSANKSHGLRRTNEDKQRAVRAALSHPLSRKLSNRQIAEHCGVDHVTVRKYREVEKNATVEIQQSREPNDPTADGQRMRTGRDGRTINTANIGRRQESGGSSQKPRTRLPIHQPRIAPSLMEKMTALSLPHNPVMGAMTLIECFSVDYLRVLVEEINTYLMEQEQPTTVGD